METLHTILNYLICALAGYLVGTLNPSYLLAALKGFDIRRRGSGNAGASNALILLGKKAGAICAAVDIFKAFIVVFAMTHIFPNRPQAFAVTATACILGHIFPFYMKFKGGKGLACMAGIVLCYDWRYFLIALPIAVTVALLTNYICTIPLTAAVAFPISYGLMRRDVWGMMILFVASVFVILRHLENLSRIRRGTEMRLSYLWNKEREIERLEHNTGKSSQDYL